MHPLRKSFGDFINEIPFETMVTLRFEKGGWREEQAQKAATLFVRAIAKGRKIRVAALGVFNCLRHPHMHLCLFGEKGTVADLADGEAQRAWKHGSAKVSPIYDAGGGCYIGKNVTPNEAETWALIAVGRRPLKRARRDRGCPGKGEQGWAEPGGTFGRLNLGLNQTQKLKTFGKPATWEE